MESLSQNHPFVDGNKRTAFAATYTFLAINGVQLTADSARTEDFVLGLYAAGSFQFDRLEVWLRENGETVMNRLKLAIGTSAGS